MRVLFVLLIACVLPTLSSRAADPDSLKGAVIVVDPGHGGQSYSKSYTGGTRGVTSRMTESELNLKVALVLAKKLRDQGATVYLTREADHRLSPEGSTNKDELHARIDFFEHHNCHFFLSVHHNAGGATASGHTTLYKHNATDDTLYESIAQKVNETLVGAVPGPKLKLIKGSYHILRETPIPGTITESGFMTNRDFDALSIKPEFPEVEAAAIALGATKYWTEHKTALIALREKLAKERAEKPRSATTYSAIALNPAYQAKMQDVLRKVAMDGKYSVAAAPNYVAQLQAVVINAPKTACDIKAEVNGEVVHLTGRVTDRAYHDHVINMLVAMKLYRIKNDIEIPKPKKD